MQIKRIHADFSICKISDASMIDFDTDYCFVGRTDEELSLVCESGRVPRNALVRDDGWRAFRIQGVLDFSLIGILAEISAVLAANSIGIFALSTFNTDYILVKKENYEKALATLACAGHEILP